MLRKVIPKYPAEAKKKRIQGTVRFRTLIGKDGNVEKLRVVSSPPILVKAAEDAVRQGVYEPTMLNGKPVEVTTFITVVFTLAKHDGDKENHA
jgi:protein TonB